jgi:hypothetical protein
MLEKIEVQVHASFEITEWISVRFISCSLRSVEMYSLCWFSVYNCLEILSLTHLSSPVLSYSPYLYILFLKWSY